MENKYVIGVDFGSDSVRSIVVSTETGDILGSSVRFYPRWKQGLYCNPQANAYRQHPLDYTESLTDVINDLTEISGRQIIDNVVGISFDTTASTPVLTDSEGTPLALNPAFAENPDAMFILWKDHTAIAEASRINDLAKKSKIDYTKYSGGAYSCEWAFAKVLHILENNPHVGDSAYAWIEHCDWMTALLTENTKPEKIMRSRCTAGHKAMWHASWGGYPASEFLSALHPRLAELCSHMQPITHTADTRAGGLCAEWAKRLGLKPGIAVGLGAIDCHVGAVGAGITPGTLVKVMGTSTCDIAIATYEQIGERAIKGICGQVDGSVIPGSIGFEAGQAAFGDIYAWFRKLLAWPLHHVAGCPEAEAELLSALTRCAEKISVSESSPIALDWFNGRRTPDVNPLASGVIAGLTLGTDAPTLFRALVEATAMGSRAITERMKAEGVGIERIIAIGGITKKSPFVMQIMSDVIGLPIETINTEQACALGAAMLAAVAAGVYPSIPEASQHMAADLEATYVPNPEVQSIYDYRYEKYCRLGVNS